MDLSVRTRPIDDMVFGSRGGALPGIETLTASTAGH